MTTIYSSMLEASNKKEPLLAILIDPEKTAISELSGIVDQVHKSRITHVFVGGSTGTKTQTDTLIRTLKKLSELPVILFPGHHTHLSAFADGILFLSLLSGRNPEYLIEQQIKAAPFLKESRLEIIPTGYILIDGGHETMVQKVSQTTPISQNDIELIKDTAMAGAFMGKQLIYLEAGSGASTPVSTSIIKTVKQQLQIPLIVGGGIRSKKQLNDAYKAGADLVVIGTAFEQSASFFNEL